jgi:hypothetical protein
MYHLFFFTFVTRNEKVEMAFIRKSSFSKSISDFWKAISNANLNHNLSVMDSLIGMKKLNFFIKILKEEFEKD